MFGFAKSLAAKAADSVNQVAAAGAQAAQAAGNAAGSAVQAAEKAAASAGVPMPPAAQAPPPGQPPVQAAPKPGTAAFAALGATQPPPPAAVAPMAAPVAHVPPTQAQIMPGQHPQPGQPATTSMMHPTTSAAITSATGLPVSQPGAVVAQPGYPPGTTLAGPIPPVQPGVPTSIFGQTAQPQTVIGGPGTILSAPPLGQQIIPVSAHQMGGINSLPPVVTSHQTAVTQPLGQGPQPLGGIGVPSVNSGITFQNHYPPQSTAVQSQAGALKLCFFNFFYYLQYVDLIYL